MRKARQSTDQELRIGLCKKDRAIIHEIYDRFQTKIIAIIKNRSGSEADGKDVFQDTIILMASKICHRDYEFPHTFESNAIATAINIWQNHRRLKDNQSLRLQTTYILSKIRENTDAPVDLEEQMQQIKARMKTLSADCQRIIQLFYTEGYDLEEITKIMELKTREYAKLKLHRCRSRLKALISP